MFFIFLPFDEMLAKVPYHFFHDPAGGILSCAQSQVFCASEKWGKKECLVTYHGRQRTFRSLNRMLEWAEFIGIYKVAIKFCLPRQTSV